MASCQGLVQAMSKGHVRYPWLSYTGQAVANVVIKSLNNGIPTRLSDDILANMHSLRRSGKLCSFGSAQKRIAKQAIGNRTDGIIKIFDMSWTNSTQRTTSENI